MSEVKEELKVAAITKEMIPIMWPLVEEKLSRAVAHSNGELSSDQVMKDMMSGKMLLITVSNDEGIVAALALEQRDFPTGKRILNITLAGGSDSAEWIEQIDDITQKLAKDYKCDEVYIIGRKGWVRALKSIGYEVIHTVVGKKVGD